ncbi:MAG: NAD(P)/FAD-dependent oxidoreductase [Oscillospiraceae bacterium]|nr:NAD(P)/FAD-dependent oxidoreductase [Oscillospiraceae bacterium]
MYMKKQIYDVIVIGGGAAGLLASALAAEQGFSTLLIERNEKTGRKLRITGKGRCNVTNNCRPREVIDNIPTGGRFLCSAMNAFSPEKVMAMFEAMGVPLKTERGSRVFPVSDHAGDIVGALNKRVRKAGVELLQAKAEEIETEEGRVSGVRTDKGHYLGRRVLLCTGGMSYPLTGSDGSGYSMAQKLGHSLIEPKASLVPLEIAGNDCPDMQGLSLKNVAITITDGGKKPVYQDFGELLFTHFGVSGPLILSASAHLKDYEHKHYRLSIDLKPALDEKTLDARLLRDFSQQANRDYSNCLGGLVNKLMIPVIVRRSEIPPATKVNSITKQQRRRLLELLKGFTLDIEGPRPVAEAIITSGGVDCGEINPKTMESKLVPGLYFAGEVINCDGYTGGFNLQIAWATAYAAASHFE